jgi:hypothetical protein
VKNKSLSDKWDAYVKEIKGYGDDKIKKIFGFDNKITEPPREINKRQPEDEKIYGEFIRRHHHELSREIINGLFPGDIDFDIFSGTDYAFDSKTRESDYKKFRSVIGIVAESHGVPIRNTEESLKNLFGDSAYKNPLKIPVFFIMAVLRLADLLDAGEHRAPEVLQNSIGIKSFVSKDEWIWNQRINIDNYDFVTEHGYLYIDADPETGMEYIKIAEWLKYIQSELDLSWAVISEYYSVGQYNLTVHRVKSNIFDEPSKKNYDDRYVTERAAFKVMPDLLKLLIQPLYGDNPTYGVRELLQNAVDACNEREALGNYSAGEEGKITVSVDTKAKTFTIEDNGIGMTKDVILGHYLSIGSSYRFSEDYLSKYMEDGKSKVSRSGRFGIGVLAMFLIGRFATVTTRSYDEELGYEFTLELEQENIEIKRVKCEVGTRVSVDLDDKTVEYFVKSNIQSFYDWRRWFWCGKPEIIYYIDKSETFHPIDIESDNDICWFDMPSENFSVYKWTYSKKIYNNHYHTVFCNGIMIRSSDKISSCLNFDYNMPFIFLLDHNNNFRTNLSRNTFFEIPDKNNLQIQVYKLLLACLLTIDFDSPDSYKSELIYETFSNHLENLLIISKYGYTLFADVFIYCASLKSIAFCYEDFNAEDNNIDEIIESHSLNVIEFSIKDFTITDFVELSSGVSMIQDDIVSTWLNHSCSYNTNSKMINWYNYKPFMDKYLPIIETDIKEIIINSEIYNNTYQINFDPLYIKNELISLTNSVPTIIEYSIDVVLKTPNNPMLQLIREYLMETSDDIWIPFDMEERKKKFPKAFRELARFM